MHVYLHLNTYKYHNAQHGKHTFMCWDCNNNGERVGICAISAAPVFAMMDKSVAVALLEGLVSKDDSAKTVAEVLVEMMKFSVSIYQQLCQKKESAPTPNLHKHIDSFKDLIHWEKEKDVATILGQMSAISASAVLLKMDGLTAVDLLVSIRAQRYDDDKIILEMKSGAFSHTIHNIFILCAFDSLPFEHL